MLKSKKNLFVVLLLILSISALFSVGCGKKNPTKNNPIEINIQKEFVVPVNECFIPNFTVTPSDTLYQVTVTSPSNESVSLGENYSFTPNVMGEYILKVYVDSDNYKTSKIIAVDGKAPEIIKNVSDKQNVSLGVYSSFEQDLNELLAEDDVDGTNLIKVVNKYRYQNGKMQVISNNEILLNKVGVYTLYGYVEDMTGNFTEFSYILNVVDTVKPIVVAKMEYYAWLENGKVVLPDVEVEDDSINVSIIKKVFLGQTEIPVVDNAIEAQPGIYSIKFVANDGYNNSDEVQATLRVLEKGVLFDFASSIDADKWTTDGIKSYSQSSAQLEISSSSLGEVSVVDSPISDWSKYGYIQLSLKNNKSTDVRVNFSLRTSNDEYIVADEFTLSANESVNKNVTFREANVDANSIKGFKLSFAGAYDVTISQIKLCNLPQEIFNLSKTEYDVKTYDTFELPKINYVDGYEDFVKKAVYETEINKNVEEKNGKYIFKAEGEYVFTCKVTTKTNEIFTKKVFVNVVKGDPQIIIEGLPLGKIGEELIISRYYLANIESPTLKVYYSKPNSDEKIEIIGNEEDGYAFTPTMAGSYLITFEVGANGSTFEKSDILYVKQIGEIISYESNNGVIEGWPSNNDWGYNCDEINYDQEYVYSGKSSMKYIIASGREIGTTYQNADIIIGTDGNEDVLSMALYASNDTVLQIYMITNDGAQYGYSQDFSLEGGKWNVIYTDLENWLYYGTPAHFELSTNIIGLAFKNLSSREVTLYVDEVRGYHHSDLELVKMDVTDVTVTAYETIALPVYEKTLLFDSAYEYTLDETTIGIEAYLYKVDNASEKRNVTGVKNFFFTEDGEYVFEVIYKAFGEDYRLVKNIKVEYATTPKIAIEELEEVYTVNSEYVLPAYQAFIPANITDYEIKITAKYVDGEISVDINDRKFKTENSCLYTFVYEIAYNQESVAVSFETYVRNVNEIINFEKIGETYDGVSAIMGGVAQSNEITDEWASQGKRSLKVTFNDADLSETSLAGAKARGILYLGEVGKELGVANASEGCNAVKLTVKSNREIKLIFDVVLLDGTGNWSKVYTVKEGVNEILIQKGDTLSGTNDFSKKLAQFNINYLCYETDYRNSGDVTIYIDGLTYVNYVEADYEHKAGEFITFEKIGETYDGVSAIMGGVAQSNEITDEWASQGKRSLKVTFNDADLTETTLAGAKARGILYLGEVGKELGVANASEGCNAVTLTIKTDKAIKVIFDIVLLNGSGNWSKVYNLVAGENQIIIRSTDTLSGTNDFSKKLAQFNINYLCDETDYRNSGDVTIYIDGLTYVNL